MSARHARASIVEVSEGLVPIAGTLEHENQFPSAPMS